MKPGDLCQTRVSVPLWRDYVKMTGLTGWLEKNQIGLIVAIVTTAREDDDRYQPIVFTRVLILCGTKLGWQDVQDFEFIRG